MAIVFHFLLSLFMLIARLDLSQSAIDLSSNLTEGELVCPQIVQFQCVGTKLSKDDQNLQWLFDGKQIANYLYNGNDTFPYRVSGAPAGIDIVIVNASVYVGRNRIGIKHKYFYVDSILTTDTSRLNMQNVGCGPDNSDPETISVDFRCVDVDLHANTSLQGNICPGVVEFKCHAWNVKSLLWYFGDDSVSSFDPSGSQQFPVDLCQQTSGMSDELTDLCKNGGRLVIDSAQRNSSSDGYDISSTLLANGKYINRKSYEYIQCGDEDIKALTLTHFTVSCNLTLAFNLQLTANNASISGGVCNGLIEMNCMGDDLAFFEWMYNNGQTLTGNYTYSSDDTFPHPLHSTLSTVEAVVSSAHTENDIAGRFNFVSSLVVKEADIAAAKVASIECSSSDGLRKQITINCTQSKCEQIESVPDFVIKFCNLNASVSCSGNKDQAEKMCIPIVIAAGSLLGLMLLILLLCCCLCGIRRRRKNAVSLGDGSTPLLEYSNDSDEDQPRDIVLKRQEIGRNTAGRISRLLFTAVYVLLVLLPDIGSRLLKYWYMRMTKAPFVCWCRTKPVTKQALQFTAISSKKCLLSLEDERVVDAINGLFKCLRHPYLQTIHELRYQVGHVSILQDFMPEGSLRDQMHKAQPTDDWSEKYGTKGTPYEAHRIATCGRHILEAVVSLYNLGFPAIGQIHSGNIFVGQNGYLLGGYENTLLGYRTSCYDDVVNGGFLDGIDVVMFGQLIYEMATGSCLTKLVPNDLNFDEVADDEVKKILQFIFKDMCYKSNKKGMQEILKHSFFQNPMIEVCKASPMELTPDARQLLEVIYEKLSLPAEKQLTDLDIVRINGLLHMKYSDVKPHAGLGWRPGKVWAEAVSEEFGYGLLSAVAVPHTCPIFVENNLATIKSLLQIDYRHLLRIYDIDYVKVDQEHVVVIFQKLWSEGSLKDCLHECLPLKSWDIKYAMRAKHFKSENIAKIGAQILNAMQFLSGMDEGKARLAKGHIHTGNIFLDGDVCQLGGLENMLLGCRPRDHWKFDDYKNMMDIFMLGHVIFEMSTGRQLDTAIPTEIDYQDVPRDVKAVLRLIFDEETSVNLDEIMAHPFFAPYCSSLQPNIQVGKIPNAGLLLQRVRKGKPRDQDDLLGKRKDAVKKPLDRFKKWPKFRV